MISLGPSSVSKAFSQNMDFFKEFLASPKIETRAAFAHIFGIIGSEEDVSNSILESNLLELTEIAEKPITSTTSQEGLNKKHGSILCLAYLISRCLYRGRKVDQDIMKKSVAAIVSQLHLQQTVSNVVFIVAAEQALQEIARFTELPFPRGVAQDDEDGKTVSTPKEDHAMDVDQPEITQREVVRKFASIVKSSQDNKLQERALLALGNIGMTLVDGGDLLELAMKVVYDSADSKQVELAFAAGEAFSYIVSGWNSEAMIKFKDISDVSDPVIWDNEEIRRRQVILEQLFNTIFTKYITSPKAWYRKAACTWILCVVKFCKSNDLVRVSSTSIHCYHHCTY